MSLFGERMRAKAAEYRSAANAFALSPEQEKIVAATAGHVTAAVFEIVAEYADHQAAKEGLSAMGEKRKAIMERNEAIRKAATRAAVTGDWSEFDRLSAGGDTVPAAGPQPNGTTGSPVV